MRPGRSANTKYPETVHKLYVTFISVSRSNTICRIWKLQIICKLWVINESDEEIDQWERVIFND